MNQYHQWKTQCPKCGESDSLFVVEITLSANHEKMVLSVQLQADGFVFDVNMDCDHSTEDELVKCMACGVKFTLSDLEIDTYYKVDPATLGGRVEPFQFAGMSERSFFQLAIQKQALVRAIENAQPKDEERLTGILHMIDGFQDYAVSSGKCDEVVVFPITQDEKEAVLKETEVEDIDV